VRRPRGSFMIFSPASIGRALLDKSDKEVIQTHLADLDQVLGHGFAGSVVEARTERWKVASPNCFPGREKLQSALMHGKGRISLAGDFLGNPLHRNCDNYPFLRSTGSRQPAGDSSSGRARSADPQQPERLSHREFLRATTITTVCVRLG
jgi:hypothetical protein